MKKILFLYLLLSSLAYSRPVTAPGMFVGIPFGKPFPSGKYFLTMPAYISIPSTDDNPSTNVAFNIASLSYVPDFKILNATPIIGACIPQAF